MYDNIAAAYAQAQRRLLLLDYDGTLSAPAPRPELAKPTSELLDLLERLASDPHTTAVIISGRNHQELEAWLGHLPLEMAGEHGSYIKQGESWLPTVSTQQTWKPVVRAAMEAYTSVLPGSLIEEKTTALVWHFRLSDAEQASKLAAQLHAELDKLAAEHDLIVVQSEKAIDVRIAGTDKGAAAARWLAQNDWDFILAAGDEPTDEDLFRALPASAYSFKIKGGPTAARFSIQDSAAFLKLLKNLATTDSSLL